MPTTLSLPVAAPAVAAPRPGAEDFGWRFGVMACDGEIRIAGLPRRRAEPLARRAIEEVRRIESKFSRYREASVVSRLNASAGGGRPVVVDAETAQLLDFAAAMHAQSGGLFDVTSGVLRRAWDFRARRQPRPTSWRRCCPWWAGTRCASTTAAAAARCCCRWPAWSWTSAASARSTPPTARPPCCRKPACATAW